MRQIIFTIIGIAFLVSCKKNHEIVANQGKPLFKGISVSIDPNGITPLAGIIDYQSDQEVTLNYKVHGQDNEDFIYTDPRFTAIGSQQLFALYPGFNNKISLTITNREGVSNDSIIYIQTNKLSTVLPGQENIILNAPASKEGKTTFILFYPFKTVNTAFNSPDKGGFPFVIDKYGKIRGLLNIPDVLDMKLLSNGHYLYTDSHSFYEIDLLGNIYHQVLSPTNCHHDFTLLPNGNLLLTGEDSTINGTVEDKIYEINYSTGSIVKTINLYNIFDPKRKQLPAASAKDWFHNNSICYDAFDNSMIITGRSQSVTAKIDLGTQKLQWMISDSSFWTDPFKMLLLKPTGADFEHSYGQHSAQINPANHNKMIVFDNGNLRSYTNPLSPIQSYSRLVEYNIDPVSKTVAQSFEFGKVYGSANFSPATGNVDYITNDNLFICFPLILKDAQGNSSATGVPRIRFMEIDRIGNIKLDITVMNTIEINKGIRTYRAHPFNFFQ